MKKSINAERSRLTELESAAINGGSWIPYLDLAVFAIELGQKIINWLTTDHKL